MRRSGWLATVAVVSVGCFAASSCGGQSSRDSTGGAGGAAGGGAGGFAQDAAADAACPKGAKSCGGSCVNIDDPAFGCTAGACAPCAVPNATTYCSAGACAFTCAGTFLDCDALATNGCEINGAVDELNCGGCGVVCDFGHPGAICSNGNCEIACAGEPSLADCDGDSTNGCEIDTYTDAMNCGWCGNVCASGQLCFDGYCACAAGLADCNLDPSDGCEANLSSDVSNCGACGNACTGANGSMPCVSGKCACCLGQPGWANCDGICSNGCEVNLMTDVLNCGACNSPCAPGETCLSGSCQ